MGYCWMDDTPLGRLLLAGNSAALRYLVFENSVADGRHKLPLDRWRQDDRLFSDHTRQLSEYFAGHRREFLLPVEPQGTAFQQKVWSALLSVPYGQTATYAEIAAEIGQPTAARAVGLANGRNPISIIIPCHRIIGANRKLVGYGGGLSNKKKLLNLEGIDILR